jgi:hypothetical protein
LQGLDASGRPINPDFSNLTISFDSKDHPTPSVDYETTAWTRIDANRYEVVRKRSGKVVLTSLNVVSPDGRTMTITTHGIDTNGHQVHNVRVFERR